MTARRGIFGSAIVIAAGAAAALSVQADPISETNSRHDDSPRARAVRASPVVEAPGYSVLRFVGVVRSEDRANLAFTSRGRVVRRSARVGQRIRKGQEIARLDLLPLRNAARAAGAQVEDIEARLTQLGRDVKRTERLRKEDAASEESLEKLVSSREATQASLDSARARLEEANRQLRDARLVAPFDGTVVAVRIEPGEVAQAGAPVVVLTAQDRFEVAVEVPEHVRAGLMTQESVGVRFPLAGLPATQGTIDRVSSAAAGPGQLFTVVVTLEPTRGLAAGYTAEVALRTRTNANLMVPIAAVADPGGQSPFVFRIQNGRAERISVLLGDLIEDHVAIAKGLRANDLVVTEGHVSLLDGEAVEVVP